MLFRPSFCCNCGQPIERSEWKLWNSRRFCQLCETDFTAQEWLPKGTIALAMLVLVIGTVNYFFGGQRGSSLALTRAAEKQAVQNQNANNGKVTVSSANTQAVPSDPKQVTAATPPPAEDKPLPRTLAAIPAANPDVRLTSQSSGPIYFCGAETKKGTPCSRKVRGNVRCWQHTGMPAMLPPDKLLVSR